MTNRPILFTGEMVRAILAGRKTMTRRVIRPQFRNLFSAGVTQGEDHMGADVDIYGKRGEGKRIKCPYGKAGDQLYVRENWKPTQSGPRGLRTFVRYKADDSRLEITHDKGGDYGDSWRPSIHMPQRFSRITLDVENIAVQRLQEITAADCQAEGSSEGEFRRLWDIINAERGYPWHSNPWLWVVSFRVAEIKHGGKDGNEDSRAAGLKTFG